MNTHFDSSAPVFCPADSTAASVSVVVVSVVMDLVCVAAPAEMLSQAVEVALVLSAVELPPSPLLAASVFAIWATFSEVCSASSPPITPMASERRFSRYGCSSSCCAEDRSEGFT